MPTRTDFLIAYEKALIAEYPWARDPLKLTKFMQSVANTISTNVTTANLTDSPVAQAAFKAIGCKGKLTYKALRALPS